jgi:GNAT superfamily N-acetyltransferase
MDEPSFEIRPGRRDDARAAARLWMRSAEEHARYDPVYETSPEAEKTMRGFLADLSSSSHSFLFVAEADGEIIGFVSGELREGSPTFNPRTWASVDDVFVEEDHRGHGAGKALLEEVRTWAVERNASGVSLQAAAANERGRKFYRDLGFREVSIYQVLEF